MSGKTPLQVSPRERFILKEALAVAIEEYEGSGIGFGPFVDEAKILRKRIDNCE